MPHLRLFRRNNQTSECPHQAPGSQNVLFTSTSLETTTTNNEIPYPEDGRHQKIMDFYNRKSQRGAPVSLAHHTSSSETSRNQRSRSDLTSYNNSNRPNAHRLVPFPSNNSAEVRSTWALRQARINESPQISHVSPEINGGQNDDGPMNSFVILQPFFVEFQDLAQLSLPPNDHPSIPPSIPSSLPPFISPSITLPDTFLPIHPIDESMFINQLTLLEGTPPVDNISSLAYENEIDDSNEDPEDEEDVKAPEMFGDDTTCTICSGIFRDPRILTCGHTFCLKCLVRMHRHTRQPFLVCPICREQTIVYTNDLKYLTKNFVVKNLVETIKISSKNEKYFKSQLEENFKNETQSNNNNKCSTIELREIKSFPLKEGHVKGVAILKQKIYLVFERSNQLLVVATKTFFLGTPRRDETITLDGISNPIDMTSKEDKNFLFILDSSNFNKSGIVKRSIVWKVLLPDGKSMRGLKIIKWMDGLQTGRNIMNAFNGLMIIMLVFESGRYSVNFYLAESEFGELTRRIHLDGSIRRPVQISRILNESEIAISHQDERTWKISLVNLDGKVLSNVTYETKDQISNLISDEKNLFITENNKNRIIKMDRNLKEKSYLEIKCFAAKTITFLHLMDQKKFIVCSEGQMSICET